jgi:23S rRNA U2552 (ribose-2'-O)-methylase RlmE/FtsJ
VLTGKRVVDLGAHRAAGPRWRWSGCGPRTPAAAASWRSISRRWSRFLALLSCTWTARPAEASARAKQELGGGADVVLSDMAPAATGHQQTDHIRIMGLAESAYETAKELLEPGGAFIVKVWQGGAQKELLDTLKREFDTVRHVKPPASRSDSAELYLVALGFRGRRGN